MKKLLGIVGTCLALTGVGVAQEDALSFADPNLEAAVREAIGKEDGALLPADVAFLTRIIGAVSL